MEGNIILSPIQLADLISQIRSVVREEVAGAQPGTEKELLYYSRKEVCQLLKISEQTLCQWQKTGRIKASRIGRRVLFARDHIESSIVPIRN